MPSYAEQVSVIVRTLRAFFSMSQTDLAQASGISRPTINRVETQRDVENIRTGTLEALFAVFRRLGVQLELSGQGLVLALPLDSVMAAIEAGKSQGKRADDNSGKAAIMGRATSHMFIGDREMMLSPEDFEALKRAINEGNGPARGSDGNPGSDGGS